MGKYKDEDTLIKGLHDRLFITHFDDENWFEQIMNQVIDEIKNAPTADVVEVVRCGECKHLMPDGRCYEFADDNIKPSASDYCSYGERKDG